MAACGLAGAVLGCQSAGRKPASPSVSPRGEITEIHLLSSPAAVNFEAAGGAAGFAVRIYASNPSSPKTVPIRAGTLEILMFDGAVPARALSQAKPLRVWSYPAGSLQAHARTSPVGISYPLTALWGEAKPAQDRITVAACYTAPQGTKIYSAAAIIFVSTR